MEAAGTSQIPTNIFLLTSKSRQAKNVQII